MRWLFACTNLKIFVCTVLVPSSAFCKTLCFVLLECLFCSLIAFWAVSNLKIFV